MTPFLKNAMAIIKENNVFLITGQRAASWLAAQSCVIGIDARRVYKQEQGASIAKLSQIELVVFGDTLPDFLSQVWEKQRPAGTISYIIEKQLAETLINACLYSCTE